MQLFPTRTALYEPKMIGKQLRRWKAMESCFELNDKVLYEGHQEIIILVWMLFRCDGEHLCSTFSKRQEHC